MIKHVFRRLMRSPIFTLVTLATIAIGIGANTAIFSVVNGVLLKPLPYPEPERLVAVWQSAPGINLPELNLGFADYFTFREENRSFQDFGIWNYDSFSITGKGAPERVEGINVTSGILPALGARPVIGRLFSEKDDTPGSPATAILSYGYWMRSFGGDPTVIGRRIVADGTAREIIGVLPQNFHFLDVKPEMITPFQQDRGKTVLGNFSFQGIARLKPGVSIAQANQDLARMIPMVNTRFAPPPGFSVKIFEDVKILPNVRPLMVDVIGDLERVLWVLMGSIGVVLLIACANVANLLLVRAEGRQQELAIRSSLGANWTEIARELLVESVSLGVLGGIAGLGLAYAALRVLVNIAPASLPRLDNITIDPTVLAFTLGVSLLAGLLFGLIPVLKYGAPSMASVLRAGGRSLSQSKERHRVRNTLVVGQVAMALVLLISSGLMIRTFFALRQVQPGFTNGEQLQTARIYIPDAVIKEPDRVLRNLQDMEQRLSAIPGVTAASFGNSIPTDGNNSNDLLYAEDRTYREGELPPIRRYHFVAPGYFHALGTRFVAGRDYTWTDIQDKRLVVIVTENMARELWGGANQALGKRIREGMKDDWREIIGVVQDVHDNGPDQKAPTTVYWPVMMKNFYGEPTFVQRSAVFLLRSQRTGSESFLKEVREAIWSVNGSLPVTRIKTMAEVYRGSMARSSFTLVMLAIAGSMALLLGVVGIYGVISYSVSQRTRELGIRIALGAQPATLQGMVVRHGVLLAGIGVAIGLAGAAGVTRIMASFLFNVSAVDPITYVAVSLGLLAAAAVASYIPAYKASVVNPVDALRAE
ncbi:MAG TPA: ABC transporter permease [Bryobacteraceae bacterium]|nr:ABC transporter permease [Bryobacteraceae bacterium]